VRDDFCAGTTHQTWQDVIPSGELLKALRADKRSDVGAHLGSIRVLRRDASGRAEQVALEGERRRVLRGWDFKLIVGRTLGWNVLKSSRFEVMRAGGNFIFRGSGFGHGLGLCQSGAHVMAHRGASYRQIIGQFFPGTTVGRQDKRSAALESAEASPRVEPWAETRAARTASIEASVESVAPIRQSYTVARQATFQAVAFHTASRSTTRRFSDFTPSSTLFKRAALLSTKEARKGRAPRLTLSSEHFRVSYPSRVERREVEAMLRTLEGARRDVLGRLESTGLNTAGLGTAELYVHETTGDFTSTTGQPAWVAASTNGRRIDLQPPGVLRRRGVLSTTLRHEFVHVALETLGRGRAPLWLVEGLAAYVAGEGALLARSSGSNKLSVEELERSLARPASEQEMQALYAAALAEVRALIRREGEAAAWLRAVRSASR
jgi:hypothetical protein